jgi:hypothetical protein
MEPTQKRASPSVAADSRNFEAAELSASSTTTAPIAVKEEGMHLAQRQLPISTQEMEPAPKAESKNQTDVGVAGSVSAPVAKMQTEPAGESCGTHVDFARNPTEAARLAKQDNKLMFVLHVSGNFEESKFT